MVELQKIHEQRLQIDKAEQLAKSASMARLAAPESLDILLAFAKETLKVRTNSARAEEAKHKTVTDERSLLLSKTISNGKFLVDQGKFSDAFKEWASLLPILDDEAGLERTLEALESDLEAAGKAEREASEAESKKNIKVTLPDDLSSLILEAGRQIRAQNDAASARKKQAEQSVVDKQVFVTEHFDKGTLLFDAGKLGEALKEWSSILPDLEEESKLKPLIEQAQQDQQALAAAQKAAQEADSLKDRKFKTPADLEKLLQSAS